jgi:hypothetical protein
VSRVLLDDVVRAKRPQRLPVVLSRKEIRMVLERLEVAKRSRRRRRAMTMDKTVCETSWGCS